MKRRKTMEQCDNFNTCYKIKMVLDKDLLNFQYAEAIECVCMRCNKYIGR